MLGSHLAFEDVVPLDAGEFMTSVFFLLFELPRATSSMLFSGGVEAMLGVIEKGRTTGTVKLWSVLGIEKAVSAADNFETGDIGVPLFERVLTLLETEHVVDAAAGASDWSRQFVCIAEKLILADVNPEEGLAVTGDRRVLNGGPFNNALVAVGVALFEDKFGLCLFKLNA